jgi:hypothetical protein
MNVRPIRALLGGGTLAASGTYTFVYLYRWEWNLVLISSVIFVAAVVLVMRSLLAEPLTVLHDRVDVQEAGSGSASHRLRLHRIRAAAPPPRANLSWVSRPDRMNVFVPVLMGAGVLLSGIAWAVERIARGTVSPVAERGLANQLDGLALPTHGFVTAERAPLDLLRGPIGRRT